MTSRTQRTLRCRIFGEDFSLPGWQADRSLPLTEPLDIADVRVSRSEGVSFFVRWVDSEQRAQELEFRFPLNELNGEGTHWRECWDKLDQPSDLVISGTLGWRMFKLLRLYQIGAADGDSQAWREALDESLVGWRDLECSRPDLLSVPLLQQWKDKREAEGLPINRRARPRGARSLTAQQELDDVAIGIYWCAQGKWSPKVRPGAPRRGPITWKESVWRRRPPDFE